MKKILLICLIGFASLILACTFVMVGVGISGDDGSEGGSTVVTVDQDYGVIGTAVPPPTVAPIKVTTQDIYQAYQENEARANATYKNQKLELTFRVDEVEDKYVTEELDDWMASAQLEFSQADLITFNVGERVTAICELDGFEMDLWLAFDCKLGK
ncbi:MAG: hypothetical protein OXR67_11445 [Chloroflexota bacterium]|nr:hypothetical protein [Chloroflexota bacterium]